MIRVERDPALPPGKAEALDRDGNLLATITLPNERVPSGTVTVRVGGGVFDGVIASLNDLKGALPA
jgi:hypothetical protein